MEEVSRRNFFKQAGSVAAVAVVAGGVGVAPIGVANAVAATSLAKDIELSAQEYLRTDENLIAQVKNARTGEISIFIGLREVTFHDRKVAARLIRATR